MLTLRRILKYTPAVVLALLIVAWAVSVGREFGVDAALPLKGRINSGFENGTFYFGYNSVPFSRFYLFTGEDENLSNTSKGLGRFETDLAFHTDGFVARWWFDVPVVFLVSVSLPLAIGPFISFRFRLWHYLAYTALVAVELACYLRWQE